MSGKRLEEGKRRKGERDKIRNVNRYISVPISRPGNREDTDLQRRTFSYRQ